jgi:hypothetical protein
MDVSRYGLPYKFHNIYIDCFIALYFLKLFMYFTSLFVLQIVALKYKLQWQAVLLIKMAKLFN